MRLAINIRPLLIGKIGGMENYVRNIVARLVNRGDIEEICLLTSTPSHGSLDVASERVREVLIADDDPSTRISRELARRKTDILFCPLIDLEPGDSVLPSLVTIPDVQHESRPELFDARALAWRRHAYRASATSADIIFTLSAYSRESICRAYGTDARKVLEVPLDVDDVFRAPSDSATDDEVRARYRLPSVYVFYPAITWRHKNHVGLLKALQLFNTRHRPLSLVLCGGEGNAHAEVTEATDRLGLRAHVTWLGRVPPEHLPAFYRGAVALVLPSLFEGFGLPILEAFHTGCAVACSNRTSCPEVAGDAAEYFDPGEPADIAAALVRLTEKSEWRAELVARGQRRASLFSWAEAERVTFEAMRGLLARARRAIEVESPWPSFTVVTPSLNQAQFIGGTIESVLGQQYPHLQHIVVDGGSTDGTIELLRGYGGRVRWLSEPDRGQADAVNKGVRLGRGELIGWLNSDDTYWPGALERAALAFRRLGTSAVVYGDANHVFEDGSVYGPYPTSSFHYAKLAETCFICQPAAFIRRDAFDAVGGLDADLAYCMDYDLWIRLGRAHRFVYLPEILADSRLHKDAKTLARRRQVFREILRTVRRHFGYVPYEWVYGYANYLFNRSSDQVFEERPFTVPAFLTAVVLGVAGGRGRPGYASRFLADAARHARHRLGLNSVRFEGRWADGWISQRYVTTIELSPGKDRLAIRGRHHMPAAPPLRLEIHVNNRLVGEQLLLEPGPFEVNVPTPHRHGGTLLVTITADRSFRPLWHGIRDTRLLSCLIDEVREA